MKKEDEKLLELLAYSLFGVGKEVNPSEDILLEARKQSVSALISKQEYNVISNNLLVLAAHVELTKLLRNIPFVTFKGYASAYYYPEPLKRTMGDVDFWVDPQYNQTVIEILKSKGFRESKDEHARHHSFAKKNIIFELHNELKGMPNGEDGIKGRSEMAENAVQGYLDDLIAASRTVNTSQGSVVIPDDFHHGVIMLIHVAGHMMNSGGIGLRHICDWAVYVDKVDLSEFRKPLEEMGLWRFACQLTALCTRYLGLKKQDWAGEWDTEFLQAFIEDIFEAGNFGIKQTGRIIGIQAANNSGIMRTLMDRAKKRYPRLTEKAVFLPLGVVIYVLSYVMMQIRQKRKLNIQFIREGAQRKQLYDQFKLFEPDGERKA